MYSFGTKPYRVHAFYQCDEHFRGDTLSDHWSFDQANLAYKGFRPEQYPIGCPDCRYTVLKVFGPRGGELRYKVVR